MDKSMEHSSERQDDGYNAGEIFPSMQIPYSGFEEMEAIPKHYDHVGKFVCKMFYDEKYLGEVVSFDKAYGFYKIKYDDNDIEEVDMDELMEILAPKLTRSDFDKAVARREKQKTRYRALRIRATGAPMPPPAWTPPVKRVRRAPTEDKPKYVPLAIKEKKKDDYVYY